MHLPLINAPHAGERFHFKISAAASKPKNPTAPQFTAPIIMTAKAILFRIRIYFPPFNFFPSPYVFQNKLHT